MKKALSILLVILFAIFMCVPAYAYDSQDGMSITGVNHESGSDGSDQEEPGAEDSQSGEQGDVDNQGGGSDGSDQEEPGAGDSQSEEQGDVDNQGGGSGGSGQVEPGTGDDQSGGQGGDVDNSGEKSVVEDVYDPGTGGQDVEIEEPVIDPPVIPQVEMPVTAQRVPAFKFVGSGIIKTTLTAAEPSTVKLLSVDGIPKSINIRVFVDNVKVAEVVGGILENTKEFYIESGSKDVEFVISGYGDMSKSNLNLAIL